MDPELLESLRLGLVFYIVLVCSVSVHEWAHAFMADKLGDPLPRALGRVTLNPIAHMDPLGTVFFPLLMIFLPLMSGFGSQMALIGWGKPVSISLPNRKTRVRDELLITAAGPLSNLVVCGLTAFLGSFLFALSPRIVELLEMVILLNAALFVFNLLPIPPLDGSHFLKHVIGMREETYHKFARWGFVILLVLINVGPFRAMLGSAIFAVVGLANAIMLP